jgi:NAD(P)-dependent dehydrogenase (short-subunit alcohol dehydrogenase family)
MEMKGKVIIVTGGASGIGAALVRRFKAEGAAGLVVADLNEAQARAVADEVGGIAIGLDLADEAQVQAMVARATAHHGRVDVLCSNAGVALRNGDGLAAPNDDWERMWKIHGMAHVWAARAVVPEMVARGEGGFVVTASAAGLLNIVETAPYGVTKHASVAFAEWLRIGYGRRGVRVSCLCPQGVATAMTAGGAGSAEVDGMLQPAQVAECVVNALRDETFLVLPHPEVLDYLRGKTANYDKWLGGMPFFTTAVATFLAAPRASLGALMGTVLLDLLALGGGPPAVSTLAAARLALVAASFVQLLGLVAHGHGLLQRGEVTLDRVGVLGADVDRAAAWRLPVARQQHRQAAAAHRRAFALAHDRPGNADRQVAGLALAGLLLQQRRRRHLRDASRQFLLGALQRRGRTAAVGRVVGEQLGAAITHLPAVRGTGVDALDALRHGERLAVEDDDVSELHGMWDVNERPPRDSRVSWP